MFDFPVTFYHSSDSQVSINPISPFDGALHAYAIRAGIDYLW
jgi:hypothetical protein